MRDVTIAERAVEVTGAGDEPTAVRARRSAGAVGASRPPGLERADEEGLRAAFLAHGSELLGFARRSLRGGHGAEDVVQETFARAWRSRGRFDGSLGTLRTWLFAIERRVLIDTTTRQARQHAEPLDEHAEAGTEDRIDAALLGWQLASALDELDDAHRLVLTELYFHGRTSREVATLFGIPEGTVRSRAFYALRSVRTHLEQIGWSA